MTTVGGSGAKTGSAARRGISRLSSSLIGATRAAGLAAHLAPVDSRLDLLAQPHRRLDAHVGGDEDLFQYLERVLPLRPPQAHDLPQATRDGARRAAEARFQLAEETQRHLPSPPRPS
jgi:hypothetical protein